MRGRRRGDAFAARRRRERDFRARAASRDADATKARRYPKKLPTRRRSGSARRRGRCVTGRRGVLRRGLYTFKGAAHWVTPGETRRAFIETSRNAAFLGEKKMARACRLSSSARVVARRTTPKKKRQTRRVMNQFKSFSELARSEARARIRRGRGARARHTRQSLAAGRGTCARSRESRSEPGRRGPARPPCFAGRSPCRHVPRKRPQQTTPPCGRTTRRTPSAAR